MNQCCLVETSKVAVCGRDPIIKVFDLKEGKQTTVCELVGHEMPVSSVTYRNGKLASGGRDCTTRVWDVET